MKYCTKHARKMLHINDVAISQHDNVFSFTRLQLIAPDSFCTI